MSKSTKNCTIADLRSEHHESRCLRTGSEIPHVRYETTHYRNDWNGTQQGRSLPVGTYFYVITLAPERKLTGPVSIVF